MTFLVSNGFYDPLSIIRQTRVQKSAVVSTSGVSADLPQTRDEEKERYPSYGTKLVSEIKDDTGDGTFRRARTYEQPDGRRFTKFEEFSQTSQGGTRRAVVQENPSGSITRYEETFDPQDAGGFRRTQRFQDGDNSVETQITPDYRVIDPFVLSGGRSPLSYGFPLPFQTLRGTQLDMRA